MKSLVLAGVVLVQVAEAQGISPGRYAGPGGLTLTVTPGRYSVVRQERELIGGVLRADPFGRHPEHQADRLRRQAG